MALYCYHTALVQLLAAVAPGRCLQPQARVRLVAAQPAPLRLVAALQALRG